MILRNALRNAATLPWEYGISALTARTVALRLEALRTVFLFIGCPRSGHSLLGFLLDAHPNVACAHELGMLKYVRFGFDRNQIAGLILRNCRAAARRGPASSGYAYDVPGQWQGRTKDILALGDKQGMGAALRLGARPRLLERLHAVMDPHAKFLHVVRNPFDSITTMSRRGTRPLRRTIPRYFRLCDITRRVAGRVAPADWLEIRHEAFVENPREGLAAICRFLGIDPSPAYLEACAGIVFPGPRERRYDAQWPDPLIREVTDRAAAFPFLEGYRF